MSIYSASVAAGADDTRLANGTFSATTTTAVVGNTSGNSYHASFRFDGVTIDPGATINSTTMEIVPGASLSGATCNLQVGCEEVADAAAPTDAGTFASQQAAVTTWADWNAVGGWTLGSPVTTVDFAPSLQGVIDLGGWASGQAVNVFLQNNGSSTNARRTAVLEENTTYDPPAIDIDYTAGGIPVKMAQYRQRWN